MPRPQSSLKHTITSHTIKVGDGATRLMYSDRQAYTVVEICTPRKIVVQRDTATRVDKNGMSTDQIYEFSRNPLCVSVRAAGRQRAASRGALEADRNTTITRSKNSEDKARDSQEDSRIRNH